jgi:hypothetical protein
MYSMVVPCGCIVFVSPVCCWSGCGMLRLKDTPFVCITGFLSLGYMI